MSRQEQIYREIRRQIVEETLAPGERLVEERLAADYGVSRTPIREILAKLEADGLVTLIPHRGATVRTFTKQELLGIYDLRVLVEGYAARRAAEQATTEELHALNELTREAEQLVAKLDAHPSATGIVGEKYVPEGMSPEHRETNEGTDPTQDCRQHEHSVRQTIQDLVENNQRFHRLIAKASRNAYLEVLLERLTFLPLVYRSIQLYGPGGRRISLQQHQMLVEALCARDPEMAEAIMRAHIYLGRSALLRYFTMNGDHSEDESDSE